MSMPIRNALGVSLCAVALACGQAPQTAPATAPVASNIGAYADSLFRAYGDSNGPGASVIVLQRGQVVFRKSYGEASLEEGRAATPTTNYRLASVTKEFTAMATLLVAQDGGLRLDDSISKFFPELPPKLHAITVRNLLTHTSGLLDYEDFVPDTQTVQVHDSDVLRLLSIHDSVLFQPGERWQYSNSGYSMLALIVQKQSGKRFADFLAERIFRPLGMTHTVAFEEGISTVSERAYGYSRREGSGGWTRTDQSNTSAVLGDGGIYTSIDDMTHWAAALDAGKLVRADLLQQAFTPYRLNDGTSAKYGFGWYVAPFADLPSTWHTGETRGFRNAIRRLPTEGITIIALTNRNEGEPIKLVDSLAQRMLAGR